MTRVLVWVTPTGWEECIDAAAALDRAEVTLLHVADTGPGPPGLLGRHRPPSAPAPVGDDLLDEAQERLGRPGERLSRSGPAERVVTDVAGDFDLLVLSRMNLRPGPHSLGHAARFVVDHVPCALLLVWPGTPGPHRV